MKIDAAIFISKHLETILPLLLEENADNQVWWLFYLYGHTSNNVFLFLVNDVLVCLWKETWKCIIKAFLYLALPLFVVSKKCYWGAVCHFFWETAPLCNGMPDPEVVQSSTDAGDTSGICHHEDSGGRTIWQEHHHEVREGQALCKYNCHYRCHLIIYFLLICYI